MVVWTGLQAVSDAYVFIVSPNMTCGVYQDIRFDCFAEFCIAQPQARPAVTSIGQTESLLFLGLVGCFSMLDTISS